MNKPLVSILMTAYNREQYIGDAIESVLGSSYTNFELIIVDDGSRDRTVEIAKQFAERDSRIHVYVNDTNLGDYPNRNKAASYASGKYLKYLDSDDLIYPYGLEVFVNQMEAFPDVALGISSHTVQMSKPFPQRFNSKEALHFHFFKKGILEGGPSGTIIRRDAFYEIGQFSGKRLIGDFELWVKMAIKYPILILPPSLIYWREHEGQEFRTSDSEIHYLKVRLPVVIQMLNNSGQLLTEIEKKTIVKYNKQITAKQILILAIRRKLISSAIEIYRQLGLSIIDLWNAIFVKPSLKIKQHG